MIDVINLDTASSDWLTFVWENLGATVAVTFEQAGRDRTYEGRIAVHADGSYNIGDDRFVIGTEGIPVRWTLRTCCQFCGAVLRACVVPSCGIGWVHADSADPSSNHYCTDDAGVRHMAAPAERSDR